VLKPTEKLHVLKARANKLQDKFNALSKRMQQYEVLSRMSDDIEVGSESEKGSIDSDGYFIAGDGDGQPLFDADRDLIDREQARDQNQSTTTTEKGSNQK